MKLITPLGELNPIEKTDLGYKSTFGKRPVLMTLNVDSITLVNEDRERLFQWLDLYGKFENIPVTVESDVLTSNYYLDIKSTVFTSTSAEVPIKPFKGAQDFFSRASDTTFESIQFQTGAFTPLEIRVPFLIEKTDIAMQTIVLSLSIYSITTEIIRTVKAIADVVADALDAVGTGVLTAIAKGIALVAYLTSMTIAIINLINQLVKLYFPRLRYFKAMRDFDLINVGCSYLGYSFQSDLLTSMKDKLITVPVPVSRQNRPNFFQLISDEMALFTTNTAYPTANDTTPTLESFISQIEEIFNAETVVYNGQVRIETRSYFMQNPAVTIAEYFNEQELREMRWQFDTEDDWKRKTLGWQSDLSDLHTYVDFNGVATEKNVSSIAVPNVGYSSIVNFKESNWLFSLAERKNGLNAVEGLAKGLFNFADSLVSFFGGNSSFGALVTQRNGVMLISEEIFGFTKKIYADINAENEARQPSNFKAFLSANVIYNKYHKDLEPTVNSGIIFENVPLPITEFQFSQFNQNKFVILNGNVIELIDANFVYDSAQTELTYKKFDNSGEKTTIETIYQ